MTPSPPTGLEPVFEEILAAATRFCEGDSGCVLLRNGAGFEAAAVSGATPSFADFLRRGPIPAGSGSALGWVAAERTALHYPDLAAEADHQRHEPNWVAAVELEGACTALHVPMLRGDALIGVVTIYRRVRRPFTKEQIALVRTFAGQAVVAIENVRLFEELGAKNRELTESLEQQTATSRVLGVISSSPTDLGPVYQTILSSITRLCEAHIAALFLFDGEVLATAASHGTTPEFAEHLARIRVRPSRQTTTRLAALERRAVHVPDLLSAPAFSPEPRDLYERENVRTVLSVPMLREGGLVGVITTWRREVRPFTDKQVALVRTFADQAVIAIENVRLFNETRDALEQQTATAEILRVISSSPTDIQPVLEAVASTAARLCGAPDAVIFRVDSDLLRRDVGFGQFPTHLGVGEGLPIDRSWITGRCVVDRRTLHIDDAAAVDEREFPQGRALQRKIGHRTVLATPLLREGQAIGAIALRRMEVCPFSNRQIELLELFANQAVIAIENVRLFNELQARNRDLTEALEQQTATAEILRVISNSPADVQPVFDTIVRSAVTLCGSTNGAVFRYDGELLHYVAGHNFTPEWLEALRSKYPMRPDASTVSGRSILTMSLAHIDDVLADPQYDHAHALRGGWRRMLAVPMLREGVPLGVIVVAWAHPGSTPKSQEDLLRMFADQAVIAIENVRLLNELQARTRELARSLGELRALGEVGRAVRSTLDLEKVLTTIVSRALELAGADGGAISEYDEMTRQFHLRTTYGVEDELVEVVRAAPIRLGEGTSGKAAASRAPVQVADILDEQEYDVARVREVWERYGYRSALSVPLLREDRILGALTIWRRQVGEFPAEVVNLLQTFAAQSTLAIEHARLFRELEQKSRQLEVASQHKSEFLANMSHELRTPLNAVLGYTELVLDSIYGEVPEKIRDVITRIDRSGRHLLGLINDVLDLSKIEAGQLVLSLNDYSMDQVVQTVFTAMESLAAEKKLALKASLAPGLPAGRGDERRLSQVLLNLVGNAIKFTEAGEVRVTAALEDGRFLVCVADTGPGISPEDQQRIFEAFQQVDSSLTRKKGGTGLGLSIATRIVELHGGRLWVESAPGQGSTFSFTVPVRVERQVSS